jgi:hypothetical protein
MATVRSRLARIRPPPRTLRWVAVALAAQVLFVLVYALASDVEPRSLVALRLWVYPWVWIDVGLWAVLRTSPAAASARARRLTALGVAAYLGVLLYAGGLVGPGGEPAPLRVVWATVPPGWGPALTYAGEYVTLALVPYRVVGYLALSYLVYATILDATRSAVTGLLGVFSCVSCSWPVLASLATGLAGSGSGLAAAVTTGAYGLSTLVFVATVALLYWRPFGDRG